MEHRHWLGSVPAAWNPSQIKHSLWLQVLASSPVKLRAGIRNHGSHPKEENLCRELVTWETQKGRVSPSIGESRVGPEGRRVTGEQVLFHESPKVGGTDASINQGLTLLFRNMLGSSSSEMLPAFWGPRTKLRGQWTFLLPSWSRNRTSWVAQMQGRIEHE